MSGERAPAALEFSAPATWTFSGHWTALGVGDLARNLPVRAAGGAGGQGRPVVDGARVDALDSVGAMLIERWLDGRDGDVEWRNWQPVHRALIERIASQGAIQVPTAPPSPGPLARLGKIAWTMAAESVAMLSFVGDCALTFARNLRRPSHIRWRQMLHHIDVAGLAALPIVGLLSLLMGIVVAYQGAGTLRQYGANIFVVDLVAISMLREFAPLVTAIIVAGRSGAAYAAQLGTMAVTQEVDALRVLGIAPAELLVLPRIFALVIAMPLLTMFANVFGVFGGMLMAHAKLGIGFSVFLDRLPRAIEMSTLFVGLFKAPVFAVIIGVVGCFQGLRTSGGPDSVGTHTTRAVVQSIFLIIVVNALFSVIFSVLEL